MFVGKPDVLLDAIHQVFGRMKRKRSIAFAKLKSRHGAKNVVSVNSKKCEPSLADFRGL
jgi:hypothetical protein